jgi:hypothetical protein
VPLDAARATNKLEAINEALDAIGETGATSMPASRRNNEHLAWRWFVCSHVLSRIEKQRDLARRACVAAGVLFDHTKEPLPVGTANHTVWDGDVVKITVAVTEPPAKFDRDGFIAELLANKGKQITPALINRLVARHTGAHPPPHRFSSSLTTQ